MTLNELADLVDSCLGRTSAEIKILTSTMDAESVICLHNRLKEIDNALRNRWYELGSPNPELLK